MRKLVFNLAQYAAARRVVKGLHLDQVSNWWLGRFPLVRVIPGRGVVRCRARRLESIGLGAELFDHKALYSLDGVQANIRTFADIGCNVGYFTCWLLQQTGNHSLKGLLVDANAEAAKEAQWHVTANRLESVSVCHGLVGGNPGMTNADFYLHPSNVCSTVAPPHSAASKVRWRRVTVPCLNVGAKWREQVGDEPCDLLKVDVEGSEMEFLQAEPMFVRRTRSILVEWHKWRVQLGDLVSYLRTMGFNDPRILHENQDLGTALFVRRTDI